MKEETKTNIIGSFFGEITLISNLNKWIQVFNTPKKQKEIIKLDDTNLESIIDELNELIKETNDRKKQKKKTWKEINELYFNDGI
jgi:hypothetical protein